MPDFPLADTRYVPVNKLCFLWNRGSIHEAGNETWSYPGRTHDTGYKENINDKHEQEEQTHDRLHRLQREHQWHKHEQEEHMTQVTKRTSMTWTVNEEDDIGYKHKISDVNIQTEDQWHKHTNRRSVTQAFHSRIIPSSMLVGMHEYSIIKFVK